ncbi:MAG TPA: hypothetical protein VEU51_14400 [Candidatus Acidoferrales bacterium]|nr:hypothetical protein [Candidatus Acidoferrales bacterium]
MKRILFTMIFLCVANVASAYEYHLQFTPQSGARNLSVVGYQFVGNNVLGNCSYSTTSACSGRGCHVITTYHYNTCTWDPYGNLVSMTPGAPTAPAPLYTTGTEIVYAVNGSSTTGKDTRNFGFVATPSSHYTWQTLNGGYAVIPYAPYSVAATLISDGDLDLHFAGARVVAQIFGTITPASGTATVSANTCVGALPPGSTCTATVTYDPTSITCTGSPYGYAYTGIDLTLTTDAGANTDFTQRFTVTGIPICDD